MSVRVIEGDCLDMLRTLPAESAQTCVTSPPYFGLRDYGHDGQIGMEDSPEAFVARLVDVFREVWRVLRDDGTLWLNLGDSYGSSGGDIHTGFNARWSGTGLDGGKQSAAGASAVAAGTVARTTGLRPKNLLGIPWRVAFALQANGWYLRQEIIWHKPNPMPESVRDRCTKAHEQVFLLTKQPRYYFDQAAIAEPANWDGKSGTKNYRPNGGRIDGGMNTGGASNERNRRSVWTIASQPYDGAHFATMPPALAELCILAGSKPGDVVLDPFGGAGTTGLVADRWQRDATLIELNPEYAALARSRINEDAPLLGVI